MNISKIYSDYKRKSFLSFLDKHGVPVSLSSEYTEDSDIMLAVIAKRHYYVSYSSPKLLTDIDFIKKAVSINGLCLEYFAEEYKDNFEIANLAIDNDPKSIKFVSNRLKENKELAIKAVRVFGYLIQHLVKMQDDEEVCLEAVKGSAHTLAHMTHRIRDNKEIVLEAVKDKGSALEYASNRLREDFEVMSTAILQNPAAIHFAPKKYQDLAKGLDPWWAFTKLNEVVKKGFEINFNETISKQVSRINEMEELRDSLGIKNSVKPVKIKI